jgi:hypothetical protein
MIIERVNSVHELKADWDKISNSIYQKRSFLNHLERNNFSNQRYYTLYEDENLCAGAVIYSLKINLFTFSNYKLKLPMQVVGLPISIDESGLIGNDQYVEILLTNIFENVKGFILCLNHEQSITNQKVIGMMSLPTMIFNIEYVDWESYIQSLRHPYRRRILKALNKVTNVSSRSETCKAFTKDHYDQYLEVVNRSKTKLEVMSIEFFRRLPDTFRLNSFYDEAKLLFWHVTIEDQNNYNFLFGGLDYSLRDVYDSYTNNLIAIIKDGINHKCQYINLGQTAETSKVRFGANPKQKKMFIYHNNKLIRMLLQVLKNQLSYTSKNIRNNVFRNDPVIMKNVLNNQIQYARTS